MILRSVFKFSNTKIFLWKKLFSNVKKTRNVFYNHYQTSSYMFERFIWKFLENTLKYMKNYLLCWKHIYSVFIFYKIFYRWLSQKHLLKKYV